jgi:SHS family lactate transporter-like MFS transporter
MFMAGAIPALLVLYIRKNVPESPDFAERARVAAPRERILDVVRQNFKLTVYAACLMAGFNFFSHGTQDIYPQYLKSQHHFDHVTVTTIAVIYNIGAILGGITAGTVSQRLGRRWAIGVAAALSLPVLPLWAFATQPVWIAVGAFLMQFFVQGAWGVIPVHLNELSPRAIRGTFPGMTYQVGNFLAALNLPLQTGIAMAIGTAEMPDYRWPLVGVAGCAAVLIILMMVFGREAKDVRMGDFGEREPATG